MYEGQLDVRVSDADRQNAADRLKTALDEGRLALLEYDHRLGLAYGAVTYRDLAALFTDLPGPVPRAPLSVTRPVPVRPPKTSGVAVASLVLSGVVVLCFWLPFVGIALDAGTALLAALGLVDAYRGKRPGTAHAVAALIISLAALVPSILITQETVTLLNEGVSWLQGLFQQGLHGLF